MRLWILLGVLGFGLAMLLWNHQDGRTFGLGNDDFGRMIQLTALAALLATGFVATRGRMSETLRNAALWLLIMLVFVAGYVYRDDLKSVAERVSAGLVPGRAVVTTGPAGEQILVLHKMDHGHFQVDARINGKSASMLVDTGASAIAINLSTARRLGISPGTLSFTARVNTANGVVEAAPAVLNRIEIGGISVRDVQALVLPDKALSGTLIGMTFLSRLSSFRVEDGALHLVR